MEFTKEIAQILELSIFSTIKKESYWPLLERGRIVKITAGQMIPQSSDGTRYAGLILSGFFRLYLYAPSGRQTTVRYAKPGEMMGIVGAIVTDEKSGEPEETHVQALADSEVLAVSFEDVRFFGKKTPDLAWLFAEECARRVYAALREVYGIAFTSVRQRLARHLLLNAMSQESPPFLSVKLSQQDLADSIGTVREVVVRELRKLKKEGLIETVKGRIEIVQPGQLFLLSEESKEN
ncbi:Crp/Fnr family transcriptional regulator [Leptospira stimsonii]|uniref:Crp/Fnr family transcriptional regulator n=1 Tax=Leptospira stimsonii TaxID=2202203 RepID=A0A396Z8E3_9LEPT|nr:Crp/Fnr family transcriptional regulator [Leptospira stimsonii]RHX89400.1 Crp/Fnr family transcriptional regulator [Leptospira stimsonii]